MASLQCEFYDDSTMLNVVQRFSRILHIGTAFRPNVFFRDFSDEDFERIAYHKHHTWMAFLQCELYRGFLSKPLKIFRKCLLNSRIHFVRWIKSIIIIIITFCKSQATNFTFERFISRMKSFVRPKRRISWKSSITNVTVERFFRLVLTILFTS